MVIGIPPREASDRLVIFQVSVHWAYSSYYGLAFTCTCRYMYMY